jgi:hypothetical protein
MLFLAIYIISAIVWVTGIQKLRTRYRGYDITINGNPKDAAFYIVALALIPFVNSLFAVLVWVEYFYGEKREG